MPSTDKRGRNTPAYKRAVARLKAQRLPCWICGQPIDYTPGRRTRNTFSLDHVTPMVVDPSLENLLNPAGHRPAHLGCNSARGDDPHQVAGTSRDWT